MQETRGSTPAEAAYFTVDDETGEIEDLESYTTEPWRSSY